MDNPRSFVSDGRSRFAGHGHLFRTVQNGLAASGCGHQQVFFDTRAVQVVVEIKLFTAGLIELAAGRLDNHPGGSQILKGFRWQ